MRYIDSLKAIADGKATKVFLPLEMQGLANAVAGIGEIFQTTQATASETTPNELHPTERRPDAGATGTTNASK